MEALIATGGFTHNCQEDVDEEIGTATTLEKDSKRRKNEGEDDLADVTRSKVSGYDLRVPLLQLAPGHFQHWECCHAVRNAR